MREAWGIGKRIWGKNWEQSIWLYDTLAWTVMGYGVEICGWKERKEVEEIHKRFLKWTMGVEDTGVYGARGAGKMEDEGKSWKKGLGL
ncbi:myb-binding protein 1a [Lasius niger]|uniref:Myb-binding protein 1a n=1 Tax=Lasius niger TaxID=67767 RepID=A0A0J7K1S0_LASNI|nr:myb-binding protein 1a [Lasius niger]